MNNHQPAPEAPSVGPLQASSSETSESALETTFISMGLDSSIIQAIEDAGFTNPSEIQSRAIPPILENKDIIGQAQTGSGKTAAFVLPLLEKLTFDGSVEALVLVPTRELAQQVVTEVRRLGKLRRAYVTAVVGGQSSYQQIKDINRGSQIVVATPGRMLDHLKSKRLKRFTPHMVVLDEADEMLDMGFIEDIKKILSFLPEDRQTLLFSATMPPPIAKLAKNELTDPIHIQLNSGKPQHDDIEQILYVMEGRDRNESFLRVMATETPEKAIVFCRTKKDVDELCQRLVKRGHNAKALHGDMRMEARMQTIADFRKGYVKTLIATDVASRGLDVDNISHVFNFHLPENRDRYTHRIGRTGRAGNKGHAITLATPYEIKSDAMFRATPIKQFTLKPVPTATEVLETMTRTKLEGVHQTKVRKSAVAIATDLADNNDMFSLLCQFVSYLQQGTRPSGPEQIGLSLEEVKFIAKSRNRRYGKFPRHSRSRPPRGRQGGFEGSSQTKGRRPRPFRRKQAGQTGAGDIS